MKNRKIIIAIATLLVLLLAMTVAIVFIKNDAQNYIKIYDNYVYSDEHILIVDNAIPENETLYSELFSSGGICGGACIYAVDDDGNVWKVVDIYDGCVTDAIVIDGILKVNMNHYIDGDIDQIDSCKLLEIDLGDMDGYELESYINGEIRGFDNKTGNVITRDETLQIKDLRSNILFSEGGRYFIDGKDLIKKDSKTQNIVCQMDNEYNYVELHDGDGVIYAVCSHNYKNIVKVLDKKTGVSKDVFTTLEDVVEISLYKGELYVLTESVLINVDGVGNVVTLRNIQESQCNKFAGLWVGDCIKVFDESGYELIQEQDVSKHPMYEHINIAFIINTN